MTEIRVFCAPRIRGYVAFAATVGTMCVCMRVGVLVSVSTRCSTNSAFVAISRCLASAPQPAFFPIFCSFWSVKNVTTINSVKKCNSNVGIMPPPHVTLLRSDDPTLFEAKIIIIIIIAMISSCCSCISGSNEGLSA